MCFHSNLAVFANKTHNLKQNWLVSTALWPKPQVSGFADHDGTNKKSILVHQQGLWTLGWESEMHFHSSLTIFYLSNPQFAAKFASFETFLPEKINMLGPDLDRTARNDQRPDPRASSLALCPDARCRRETRTSARRRHRHCRVWIGCLVAQFLKLYRNIGNFGPIIYRFLAQ